MKELNVGVDNYGLYPLQLDPLETLNWALDHGAEGVQFSGIDQSLSEKINKSYLLEIKQFAADNNLYLEWGGAQHIPRDMETWSNKDIFKVNQKAAREAEVLGTRIVRSCSGGLMRWDNNSPKTETLLFETAKALKGQKKMLMDYGVILSIETHFEFTTHELLRVFEMAEAKPGEYLGICLDTMNLLTMLEDPVTATSRVLPWVTCTHFKDGAITLNKKGFTTFPVESGKGVVDFKKIIKLFSSLQDTITLSVEDHGGWFEIPVFDQVFLSKFPDLSSAELTCLLQKSLWSADRVKNKKISQLERSLWPKVCEKRIVKGVEYLKKIRGQVI